MKNKYKKIFFLLRKNILFFMCFFLILPIYSSASEEIALKKKDWSFEGVFGRFDTQSIQRGYQVYKEVCSSCHSVKRLYYRNLTEIGFSSDEAKAIASEYGVVDGPDDEGKMFKRAALLSDSFVAPFPNKNAAKASHGGAFPPDLSLIIKAREEGPNYVFSLITGYKQAPESVDLGDGLSYNPYFANKQIRMPPPLSADLVEYQDGTSATLEQMAYDVVNFLQWASEPEMEKRKNLGINVLFYLFVFTILFYIAKKRIWARLKN